MLDDIQEVPGIDVDEMIEEMNNFVDRHDVDVDDPRGGRHERAAAIIADLTEGSPPDEENYETGWELVNEYVSLLMTESTQDIHCPICGELLYEKTTYESIEGGQHKGNCPNGCGWIEPEFQGEDLVVKVAPTTYGS